jgi:predicted ABC-type ATPase
MNDIYNNEVQQDRLPVIIITGYPGAGKTTLGKSLSERFDMPFVSKDEIKEILFDSLGWKDREWSMKLGATSYELMFYFAKKIVETNKPFILETYFSQMSEKEIANLKNEFNIRPIQIVCSASSGIIFDRVKNRVDSGQRHPGHVDDMRYDELAEKTKKEYEPLRIGGSLMIVDTSDFDKINYDEIYEFISENLNEASSIKNSLLERTINFVDRAFGKKKLHYVRTLYWLLQLKPDADLAFQVAAYGHDVERAFKKISGRKRLIYQAKDDLVKHQKDSGAKMYDFLIKEGATEQFASRVNNLISKHEEGGDADQNLLRDCDSISYLENNAPRNLEWLGEVPEAEIRQKFNWMYDRIGSKEAKKIAEPFYRNAVALLNEKLKNS